jgi:hypothetical protein
MNTGHFSKKCSANHRTAKTTNNNNTSLNWKIDLSEQHPVKTPTGSKSRRSTGYGCAGTSSQLKNSLPCSPQSRTVCFTPTHYFYFFLGDDEIEKMERKLEVQKLIFFF